MPVVEINTDLREELALRLSEARRRSDELFAVVRGNSLYERPIPERHRIIFYLGHLEAFDWNLLHQRALGLEAFDAAANRLFAFGIDPVDGGLPKDRPEDWPAEGKVREYVARVRETLDSGIERAMASGFRGEFPLPQLLNVAIEHRLMHCETLAYMLHQLPIDHKVFQPQSSPKQTSPIRKQMIEIPAGVATLGLARESGNFGWDNEFEAHSVNVPGFAIDQYKVTNGDYLEFMRAGGYENQALWSEADWKWRREQNITHPAFWKRSGDGWLYRGMFEEIPLPLDWPVYVSHAEASAFARWSGKSLPTEAQWHRAAYGTTTGEETAYPWGSEEPEARFGNFDFERWDPNAVNSSPQGDSGFGVSGMVGNGWEWTSSVFAPFGGFERFPFYPGYSADFFDGKHFVMKGGSARTAACMLRRSFRNWFQSHYQYVYAGFRCVRES